MTKRSRAIRRLEFFGAVLTATFAMQSGQRLAFQWFEGGPARVASLVIGLVYLIALVCAAWWIYPRTGPGSHYFDDAATSGRRSPKRKISTTETVGPRRSTQR